MSKKNSIAKVQEPFSLICDCGYKLVKPYPTTCPRCGGDIGSQLWFYSYNSAIKSIGQVICQSCSYRMGSPIKSNCPKCGSNLRNIIEKEVERIENEIIMNEKKRKVENWELKYASWKKLKESQELEEEEYKNIPNLKELIKNSFDISSLIP